MIPMSNSVAHYGPENPEMDISVFNIDVADGSTITGSSHSNVNYRKKVNDLYNEVADGGVLDTTGFVDGSMCHEGKECHSGRCENESYFSFVTRCFPKLEAGESCNEDSDCLSDYCSYWFRCS